MHTRSECHRSRDARRMPGGGRAIVAVLFVVLVAACDGGGGVPTGVPDGPAGSARFALSLPEGGPIARAEYVLTFTYLESDPPVVVSQATLTSTSAGGEAFAVLACRTRPDGIGKNQVTVSARVWTDFSDEPMRASAERIFECQRNGDTLVTIDLVLMGSLDAGFGDVGIHLGGVLCAGKVDWKDDAWVGVCPASSCGDPRAVMLFANSCQTLSGAAPDWWLCGGPTEWSLGDYAALGFFPVPGHDGQWLLGATALDPTSGATNDSGLVDAFGRRRVFPHVRTRRASLVVEGGVASANTWEVERAFAAVLTVPPRAGSVGAPEVLLGLEQSDAGVAARWQGRFTACDLPTAGSTLYAAARIIDARLVATDSVDLYLSLDADTIATAVARCVATWSDAAPPTPLVRCGALTPITGGTP